MSLTKIGSIGINTGIQLAGVTTVSTLHVGSGVTLSPDGDGFFTGITSFTRNFTGDYAVRISNTHATGQGLNLRGGSANGQYALLVENYAAANLFEINGDGEVEVKANHLRANHGVVVTGIVTAANFAGGGANLTNLNASNLASGTVPTARLGSGTASSSTFLRGDSTFQTVDTNLVADTSPQLGGNLDVNTKNITFGDSGSASDDRLTFGAGTDLSIYHDGTNTTFDNNTGQFNLDGASGSAIRFLNNGTYQCQVGSAGLDFPDTKKIRLGDSEDLELQHDGTNNIIKTSTAAEIQINNGSEYMARFIPNGSSILYEDNVRVLQTDDYGIGVYGPEGGLAQILLYSDEGDDNADKWRMINNNGDFFKIQTYKSGSWQDTISAQAENQVRLFYNGSEKLNTSNHGISLTGKIYMNNGNLQFGASGNGIDFSATGDASGASSELLDDYEEGSWTARFYPNSSSFSSSSYNLDAGTYTKIGNVVYWAFRIRIANFSGGGGNLEISGLPYTVNSGQPQTTCHLHASNWADNSPKNIVYISGNTRMSLYYEAGTANSASPTNPVPLSSLQNNAYLIGQGFYFV